MSLTVKSTCPGVIVRQTPAGNWYWRIVKTLFVPDMSPSIAEEFIHEIESDRYKDIEHVSFHQYNYYRNLDEYRKGLERVIDYLIYDNQRFVEKKINFVCTTQELLKVGKEVIKEKQRKITKTGMMFPEDNGSYIDFCAVTEAIGGNLNIDLTGPILSYDIEGSYDADWYEYVDSRTTRSSAKDRLCKFPTSYDKNGKPVGDGFIQKTGYCYERDHYHCQRLKSTVTLMICKFYGPFTSIKKQPDGDFTILIRDIDKRTFEWKEKKSEDPSLYSARSEPIT
jgi:hypothetical protein